MPGNMKPWEEVRDQLNSLLSGPNTSAMDREVGPTNPLIIMFAKASGTSSSGDIRYQIEGQLTSFILVRVGIGPDLAMRGKFDSGISS